MALRRNHPIFLSILLLLVMPVLVQRLEAQAAPEPKQDSAEETADVIDGLISQLAEPGFRARESAHQRLRSLGLPAFERLREAAVGDPNPEIARAARYLLGSQQVNWALETDSLQVRDLLQNYNDQEPAERETRHGQLARLGTPDALQALARLARFEASEELSRAAALALLEAMEKSRDRERAAAKFDSALLLKQMQLSVQSSERVACKWLVCAARDASVLLGNETAFTTKETWAELAAEESAFAQAGSLASKARGLRFFEWLGKWSTKTLGREQAIELARGVLELLSDDRRRVEITARVLLDHDLPELLLEIAGKMEETFQASSRLAFLQAEALLQLEQNEAANKLAEQTSEKIGVSLREQLAALSTKANAIVIEAARRRDAAITLYERGMFPWSEREFLKIIELEKKQRRLLAEEGVANLETVSDQEIDIRSLLASIYWEAGEHSKASKILEPVYNYFNSDDYEPTMIRYVSIDEVSAFYHFYTGLAHLSKSDNENACRSFLRAIAISKAPPNPDIVIAMRDAALGTPFESDYLTALEEMSDKFRQQLIALEHSLSQVASRNEELAIKSQVATECNQLAWLLAKCKHRPTEALQLSLRSVELRPTTPAYLDTLARCYYENGRLSDAIRSQQKACALAPHDRQLSRQLEEFARERDLAEESTGE